MFVQLDEGAKIGDALDDYEILWSDERRVLLALDAGKVNDEVPAHGGHGHFIFLTPNPELLRARGRARAVERQRRREPAGGRGAGAGDGRVLPRRHLRATAASHRSTPAARCARATARTPTTPARSTRSSPT